MGRLMFRVYEAQTLDGDVISFCVSALREISFREEIAAGEILLKADSFELKHETSDRNKARAMCGYHEF